MPIRNRRPDFTAPLSAKPRGAKWGPPDSLAYKNDGEGEGHDPPARMCGVCECVPPRSTQAKRCEGCEAKHRAAIRKQADTGRRRHKTAAERVAEGHTTVPGDSNG